METDKALAVTVTLSGCLSGSCDVARTASCEVELIGDQLLVTATFTYAPLELDEGDQEVVFADLMFGLARAQAS